MSDADFAQLITFLHSIPGISRSIGHGQFENGNWWVKFAIDIAHPLAWNVVQELGCILNYISINERLPTVFKPVSAAPYLNGGPRDFLSCASAGSAGRSIASCLRAIGRWTISD